MTMLFSDLPVIITGPGLYSTRGGGEVRIHEVGGPSTFNAKGAKIVMFRGKMRARGYNIWHVSGMFLAIGESKSDIVERIGD